MTHSKENKSEKNCAESQSRRDFLKFGVSSAGTAIAATGFLGVAADANADDFSPSDFDPSARGRRANAAARVKIQQANIHLRETLNLGDQLDNDDETRYDAENYYASFTKTLPSNDFGEVDPLAFEQLQSAMRTGDQADFDAIPLDPAAARRLANPQGAFKYEISGLDNHATRINPSHTFRSSKLAGEMAEVYWQALTRDIPFIDYDTDATVSAAVTDLNNLSSLPGERIATDGNLFRGETAGDLVGPYISQFLWKDFSFGPVDVTQKYSQGIAAQDFMLDIPNWLNVQRGGAPAETLSFDPVKRYIFNNRGLAEYVHRDVSFQAYLHAALILLGYGGAALDDGNPYKSSILNQGAFTSLGGPFILDMVTKAANLSLTGAWFQKWRVHRLLRPEAYAARVNFNITGDRSYELHGDIFNSDAVQRLLSLNGNSLLPLAYTEGSPTHPSYPAGHATIAGACVTVLKAFFDESFVLPDTVQADATGDNLLPYGGAALTVGGELNKLANNISLGRDAAGVHYRQDGVQGMFAGEQQAIALLQDQSVTVNEDNFAGFNLTKFDGTKINIIKGKVFLK